MFLDEKTRLFSRKFKKSSGIHLLEHSRRTQGSPGDIYSKNGALIKKIEQMEHY